MSIFLLFFFNEEKGTALSQDGGMAQADDLAGNRDAGNNEALIGAGGEATSGRLAVHSLS